MAAPGNNRDLIEQYREMHRIHMYGVTSVKKAPYIMPYVQMRAPHTVIDYGCGQSALADVIAARCGVDVIRYDPAIPAYAGVPVGPFDLLMNVDVLEHLPEDDIHDVIDTMANLSDSAIIIIDTHLARTVLPDGRNAHLTVRPARWWQDRLARHYKYLRPIWVRRRPASFITWQIGFSDSMRATSLACAYALRGVVGQAFRT
jgi:hypothetical protein